ncbi:TadE/TadG family type IV pilus assembly protein [Sulfitobacter sp. PS-8MA]|uniref:TadE/TadG family type IV pilus assembly protein n=1 Tax=Sulfitobacter sp. PS-8MA TaxID=3237707 RepID=UPI0034C5E9EF
MSAISRVIAPFLKNEEGSQSIELVVMAPLLVWAIVAMLAFTDAFRARAIAADATSVIADAVSRQTYPINSDYLSGLQSVAGHLTGYGDSIGVRITQISCTKRCRKPSKRELTVSFSQGKGLSPLGNADFKSGDLRERVPRLSRGDRIVLVETVFVHKPLMNIGLKESKIEMSQTTRMRFAPQLCWERCDV